MKYTSQQHVDKWMRLWSTVRGSDTNVIVAQLACLVNDCESISSQIDAGFFPHDMYLLAMLLNNQDMQSMCQSMWNVE